MTESEAFQAAFDQIDALAKAATAATTVSATVETDLVTITMTAAPHIESIVYPFSAFRGNGAEALAAATKVAIGEAVVQVQAAQAEALRSTPALASILDANPTSVHLSPEMAERVREAAEALEAQEFAVTSDDERVEVTVDGAGVITRLWFSATAGRESAEEWLADSVRTTVNAAMTQARRAQAALGETRPRTSRPSWTRSSALSSHGSTD